MADDSGRLEDSERRGLLDEYLVGVGTTTRQNSIAFGFSVTFAVVAAALTKVSGTPSLLELFLLALGGVSAYSLLDALLLRLIPAEAEEDRPAVWARGGYLSVAAVVPATAVAYGTAKLLPVGLLWLSWLLSSFLASLTYFLVIGALVTAASRTSSRRPRRHDYEEGGEGEARSESG